MGHQSHRRIRLRELPYPFSVVGSYLEHLLMHVLNRLTETEWPYRYRLTRWLVNEVAARRVLLRFIHGEVITPEEVSRLVHTLEGEGYYMALGRCECRHGTGKFAPGLEDGWDPNLTCVMIASWGQGHKSVYPRYYRRVSATELSATARHWHARGRVLSAWGCATLRGFLLSYCHCRADYCVPLKNQISRGNRVFLPGYSYAAIRAELCPDPLRCRWQCFSRCPFGAIEIHAGKPRVITARCLGCGQCFDYCPSGAAHPVRRAEGYELPYCHKDLVRQWEERRAGSSPPGVRAPEGRTDDSSTNW